ncbi:FAD-binding oxidoreductase [Geodermatophilus sp. YIM 151500]|uniref:FAD-binding oxidoreductase n=1 Tax=Geodermatophilus sp. YIM 151500 TaxID=2984531 RepID=UPI0021E5136A|nr:FAD-binding oxidoreductase [Geodermatophilus sp. YIM 151500]MCV2490975.1 FAD-binding oxidoreductase [Geodermatophilus sp. YIM 151500]
MNDTIGALTRTVRGRVIDGSDPDYDDARAVYNAMHDRRPLAVVRCTDSADVMAVVAAARDTRVPLAVRGGGHSVPGFGTVDDGLVIDMSPMNGVRVDPARKVARVGGGATWGDVDHATYPFGLAAPGGVVSTTGVAGLTLGGGIGYLTRSAGLSIDNLLSADVVLADGRQVTASDYHNEELFWALRGGGGNFGVVTSFEFRLHQVGDVVGGPLFYDVDDATAVLQCYRSYIEEAPESLGCFFGWQIAPRLPFIPENRVGELFCVLVTCWNGPHEEAERVLRPLRDVAEVQAEQVASMPFPALQSAFDDLVPKGMQNYWKADFTSELTDEAIAAHVEHGKRTPSVHSSMHLHAINGAAQRVGADETAFGHRDKSFSPVIVGMWPDPADNEANTTWVRDYYAAIHPHSDGEGGYINFMSGDDDHRAAANYGANYERLSAVKAAYDPDNLFHVNQNITPVKGM